MTISSVRATYGLTAAATPQKAGTTGTLQIGSSSNLKLTSATKIISFDAVIVGNTSDLVIDVSDLDSTGSTAWTAGTAQVETNTIVAASGATSNGNMTLVVTSTGMTGSPKNVVVPLNTTDHTSADLIAAAARTYLAADTAVGGRFTIGGTGASITLTRKPTSTYTVNGTTVNVYPANDTSLNLAIPSGLGVTSSATSTNTTAGVATAGAYCPDLDGTDFEGKATGGITQVSGIFIENQSSSDGGVLVTQSTVMVDFPIEPGACLSSADSTGNMNASDLSLSPSTSCQVTVTIAGA